MSDVMVAAVCIKEKLIMSAIHHVVGIFPGTEKKKNWKDLELKTKALILYATFLKKCDDVTVQDIVKQYESQLEKDWNILVKKIAENLFLK